MTAVPAAVAAAARAQQNGGTADAPSADKTVRRGDLRLIATPYGLPGDHRLALILHVDSGLQAVEIALVHPYRELATSMDAVVPGRLAHTPYDIVVQADLRGVVWTPVQVSRRVGQVSPDVLETISDLIEDGQPVSSSGIQIGPPLAGPQDRRWTFKGGEGKALDALTSDCAGELLEGRSPWRVAPELLVPDLLARSEDLDSILLELAHWLDTRDLLLALEDALLLEERGALDFDAWQRAGLDWDLYQALHELVENALTGPTPTDHAKRAVVAPYATRSVPEGVVSVRVMGTLARSAA